MKKAKQQAKQGKSDMAQESRQDAARNLEQARQQAEEAAKQMGQQSSKDNADPRTGDSLQQARDQMEKAQKELGQGKPGEAGKSMDQASGALSGQRTDRQIPAERSGQASRARPIRTGRVKIKARAPQPPI